MITAKDLKGFRPMTEQEIKNFGVIPGGVTFYPDQESYFKACEELGKGNVPHQTGANPNEGVYWTKEVTK